MSNNDWSVFERGLTSSEAEGSQYTNDIDMDDDEESILIDHYNLSDEDLPSYASSTDESENGPAVGAVEETEEDEDYASNNYDSSTDEPDNGPAEEGAEDDAEEDEYYASSYDSSTEEPNNGPAEGETEGETEGEEDSEGEQTNQEQFSMKRAIDFINGAYVKIKQLTTEHPLTEYLYGNGLLKLSIRLEAVHEHYILHFCHNSSRTLLFV